MADPLVIDAEHPWPWLEAFPEHAARFFNGRDDDASALQRCVLSAPMTVLFGKSGLGKSSLLQAGLFPLLRKERLFPVYIRINHDINAAPVSEQIAKRWQEEIQHVTNIAFRSRATNTPDLTKPPTDTLWVELHRTDIELSDNEGRRWQPLFVLDQFEEVFTLCAAVPERQKQVFYELGDLIENRIPKTLADRLHSDDDLFDRINLDTQLYRFLISLREDYLPDLEEWSDLIPKLGSNRYRLKPMSELQAIDAVEKTGGGLVTTEDAKTIVKYLTNPNASNKAEDLKPRRQITQKLVEPTLLSLICSGLNDKRLKNNKNRLDTDNLDKEGDRIIDQLYDNALKDQEDCLREFIEKHLITSDGIRLRYPLNSALIENLVTEEQIETLVNRRLIRRENFEEGDLIELIHDRLAAVVRRVRIDRITGEEQKRILEAEELARYREEERARLSMRRIEVLAESESQNSNATLLTYPSNQRLIERLKTPGQKKILACDGGGILSLLSIEILAKIEADLRTQLNKDQNFVLADYFDFVCGTSTGAIIASCIASGMSMTKIRDFYINCVKQMFDKASVLKRLQYSYNSEPLAKLLKETLDNQLMETNATLGSNNLRTVLMLVLHNYTLDEPWPISNNPFSKYNSHLRNDCNLNLPLWQLIRASTAAPTYFPPEIVSFAKGTPHEYEFVFIDGAIAGYNNPAYLAFQMTTAKTYAINWQTGSDKLLVVSIGTGAVAKARPSLKTDDMNLVHFATSLPSSLLNSASSSWDIACRILGECRYGRKISREFGDMVMRSPDDNNWTGQKLFTYMRYDPDVTQEGLNALNLNAIKADDVQKIDSVDYLNDIKLVGSVYAAKHVNIDHFKGFI